MLIQKGIITVTTFVRLVVGLFRLVMVILQANGITGSFSAAGYIVT